MASDFSDPTLDGSVEPDDVDDDEEPVSLSDVTSAFVTDTDWTTETILSQLRRGNIQLNPRFQRRDAWDRSRKSRFIESLVLGLPIPQLVLAEDKRRRGSFIVLDGKQRLLTLAQFAVGSSLGDALPESTKRLRLDALEVKPELRGANLAILESNPEFRDELNSLLNQTIRTVVVRNWPDEDFLNLVFLRLNTGSVRLSPQELRQALHPGPFTDFLDDYASESLPLQVALHLKGPDFRMRDVEVFLRYFGLRYRLSEYRGSLKTFLDETCDEFNQRWTADEQLIRETGGSFDEAVGATLTIFGDKAFRRWSPDKEDYERPFNRAVFDVMTYYFSSRDVRSAALLKRVETTDAFEALCRDDYRFMESIQTTTKTVDALQTRLGAWGAALSQVLGLEVEVPLVGPMQ